MNAYVFLHFWLSSSHIPFLQVIEVEKTGPRDASYSDFLAVLQEYANECRYCVFDFPVNLPVEGGSEGTAMTVDRLILMTWCPEGSKIKQKMLYSSSYDALKKALVGVYKYVQACDYEEASQQTIEDAFRKGK